MTAGISSSRTTKASNSTPIASAKPITLIIDDSLKMKAPNTEIMMMAAVITTALPLRMPSWTAVRASLPCAYASRMPEATNSW